MKTKITLLLITFLALSSCIKDYHGHFPKEIKFTPTNFIYEGDMFSFYLNGEIKNLDEVIAELKAISPNDPKYDQAKKDIIAAETKQEEFKGQIGGIKDLGLVGFGVDPDFPLPPCNCFGLRNSFEYLLNVEGNNILSISVLDKTGTKVLSKVITEFSPLPEYDNALLAQKIEIFDFGFKGEVKIAVEKKDSKGDIFTYIIDGFVELD